MRRKKPGRPSKFDEAVAKAICDDVAAGVPQEAAAICAGIDRATFYRWKKAGVANPRSDMGRFATALAQSREKAHQRLSKAVYIHAMKDGKLGLQVLARRHPKEWAEPQQRVQLSGKKGQPIETHDVVAAGLYEKLKRMEANGKKEAPE